APPGSSGCSQACATRSSWRSRCSAARLPIPFSEPTWSPEMTKIPLATDVALEVQEFGSGDPVVFLHGGAMNHRVWDHQAAAIMDTHRSLAVDLRGAGNSDKPPEGYSVDIFAEDIAALAAALDLHRPTIVGHGLGAHVALRLAA